MNTQNKKLIGFRNGIVLVLLFAVAFGVYIFIKNQQINLKDNNKTSLIDDTETAEEFGCTRTTRLDNKPNYDRALSYIAERYSGWEESGKKEDYKWYYFFPSQLVNCIKVIETDSRQNENVEGFFIFNRNNINENYFPVSVDRSYSYTDDTLTALLLIHEITHVRQYLEQLNGINNLSCIDQEVEAYLAQLRFYGILSGEIRKSVDLRIDYDKHLHPQLEVISNFKQLISFFERRETCIERNKGNKNLSECLNDFDKGKIKEILLKDDYYLKQCGLQ